MAMRARRYVDVFLAWLNENARRALLDYIYMHCHEYRSEVTRRYIEEGRKQGRQEVLVKQLGLKFGEIPDWAVQRLRGADDPTFERWIERVLTAATLAAVFIGGTPEAQSKPMAWNGFVELCVKLGRIEGRQQMLVKLLGLKFGELPSRALSRLQAACGLDIDRWAENIFTATTIDDVFVE